MIACRGTPDQTVIESTNGQAIIVTNLKFVTMTGQVYVMHFSLKLMLNRRIESNVVKIISVAGH